MRPGNQNQMSKMPKKQSQNFIDYIQVPLAKLIFPLVIFALSLILLLLIILVLIETINLKRGVMLELLRFSR